MSLITPVVAGALIRQDGAILMQQRRFDAEHGGLWEFPGGKIEPDETPDAALVRELQEELGVQIDRTALHACGFAAERVNTNRQRPPLVILLYVCRQWTGDPQCLDGAAIGWYMPDDIIGLAKPPLDVPLAAQLHNLVKIEAI
ncbi:MAG: hypothetical protein RLZZ136_345 [Pseudomonadota bacterium]